jgi:hypothetical protein
MGLHAGIDWPGAARRGWDVPSTITVFDFRLGKEEDIGDHKTQAIEFRFKYTVSGGTWPAESLWIDKKSNLPVKLHRVIRGELTDDITELYEAIDIDQPVDDKEFELPR